MPKSIYIRFYEELNDFLPLKRRKKDFLHTCFGDPAIKDIIESLGVPHTEVDLILVNGKSVDFGHHPEDGARVSVYPVFESMDISPLVRLRPKPLRTSKFILDVHLGKLAKFLRMLGFDTVYSNKLEDPEIIDIAEREKRTVLTRDIGLLKTGKLSRGYWVRATNPEDQIHEIAKKFDLKNQFRPFHRCMECNGLIVKVKKEDVADKLLPKTKKHFNEFFQCRKCGKIYWKGSHVERMNRIVEKLQ